MKTAQELDFLESYIPELANSAVRKAYLDALSSGNSVTEVIQDKIYEIFPDGSKKYIKDIEPAIKIEKKVFIIWIYKYQDCECSYDKIELLKLSKKLGYRNYLYYIATSDPIINISRVKNRVTLQGHNVPENKIISRYYRSLDYLKDAVKLSDRAYVFDNSSCEKTWICEITDGTTVDMKVDIAPKWVHEYLLDKSSEWRFSNPWYIAKRNTSFN